MAINSPVVGATSLQFASVLRSKLSDGYIGLLSES